MNSVRGAAAARCIVLCVTGLLTACPTDDTQDTSSTAAGATQANATAGADATEAGGAAEAGAECPLGVEGLGTDGSTNPLMETWGAACEADGDCVALLGEGAICQKMAVIYGLPGGYCSKPCTLPDAETRAVPDAMDCDPAGGVACIGQKGFFESCAKLCTDDMQCTRDGYYCRQMPLIANADDPKSCLMPDCCQDACSSE